MSAFLPLDARVAAQEREPPRELTAWSLENGEIYFDDRALTYYCPPQLTPRGQAIDLSAGFETSNFDPLRGFIAFLDRVLAAVMHVEKQTGRLIDGSIITQRGVLVQLLTLSQKTKKERMLHQELEFYVAGFDSQVFMSHRATLREERSRADREQRLASAKHMYSGFNFEQMATLPRPSDQCSREEIEERYTNVEPADERSYHILVGSGAGGVGVIFSAEVDCVDGEKPRKKPLKKYVELKTTVIDDHGGPKGNFEHVLLRGWLQNYISGIERITFGFRGGDFKLALLKEYRTNEIPQLVKSSRFITFQQQWDVEDINKFYARLLQWLKESVRDGGTYKLSYKPGDDFLILSEAPISFAGRKFAFLTDEFMMWRFTAQLKRK